MSSKKLPKAGSGKTIARESQSGRFFTSVGNVNVVRTVTMPNGSAVRVVRRDTLDRALSGQTSGRKS